MASEVCLERDCFMLKFSVKSSANIADLSFLRLNESLSFPMVDNLIQALEQLTNPHMVFKVDTLFLSDGSVTREL